MKRVIKTAAAALLSLTSAGIGGTAYFYRRTMKRSEAKTERTIKMSGTDWHQYEPFMKARKKWMLSQPHKDVYIKSKDGLKLHGTYFKGEEGNKAVICFHGYTSQGMSDYIGLSKYYLEKGFRMLLADERAHGQSDSRTGAAVCRAVPGE